jgi:hypothetical protein
MTTPSTAPTPTMPPPMVAQPIGYASPSMIAPVPRKSLMPYTVCFLGSVGAFALFIGATVVAANARGDEQDAAAIAAVLLFLAGFGLGIAAWVLGLIVIYRGWRLVQPMRYTDPRDARMPTPGTAIGFLFIPFFNLYWNFVAYPGLVEKLNRMAQQRAARCLTSASCRC